LADLERRQGPRPDLTWWTFSYVDNALAVGRRNHAVAVDEAHSSQTGEAAKDLKGVLGARSEEEWLRLAQEAKAGEPVTGEDRLAEAVAARGGPAEPVVLRFHGHAQGPHGRAVRHAGADQDLKLPFPVYSDISLGNRTSRSLDGC
jgi:type I restriction enzyme R subunit